MLRIWDLRQATSGDASQKYQLKTRMDHHGSIQARRLRSSTYFTLSFSNLWYFSAVFGNFLGGDGRKIFALHQSHISFLLSYFRLFAASPTMAQRS